MDIIKHGSKYADIIKDKKKMMEKHSCTCESCGCEFTYRNYEKKSDYERINAYESEDYDYVICPECKHKNIVAQY